MDKNNLLLSPALIPVSQTPSTVDIDTLPPGQTRRSLVSSSSSAQSTSLSCVWWLLFPFPPAGVVAGIKALPLPKSFGHLLPKPDHLCHPLPLVDPPHCRTRLTTSSSIFAGQCCSELRLSCLLLLYNITQDQTSTETETNNFCRRSNAFFSTTWIRYYLRNQSRPPISDDGAKETYGKVLGIVFSPIAFQSESMVSEDPDNGGGAQQGINGDNGRVNRKSLYALPGMVVDAVKSFLHPNDVYLLPEVNLQGVSWHQQKHILAFVSGPNQVTVRDYEDSEAKDPSILDSDFQRDVKLVEWRPNGGRTLSVACRGGICLWAASYPGNAASVRSGAAPFVGTISRGSGIRWTLVDFLKSPGKEHINALSWSPDGRYLASGSYESSSFTIWDVSQGLGTPIRRGMGGISILRWSPTGDFFFAAKFDGTFYFWETETWTSELWSSSSGFVTGAVWDPDGRKILISFSKSPALGSVHFASKPPALDAHLLPVDLPEIASLTGSQRIEKIAWDASGDRLALSFKDGDELYQGLIAIYDVKRSPLISASLIGFIRGPGDGPKPLAFAFHNKFKQGPLLSVCWSSGFCCTYPLIFRS